MYLRCFESVRNPYFPSPPCVILCRQITSPVSVDTSDNDVPVLACTGTNGDTNDRSETPDQRRTGHS